MLAKLANAQWVGDMIYSEDDCEGTPVYVEMNRANASDPDNNCPPDPRDTCRDFNETWHGIQLCGPARPQTFLPKVVDAGTQLIYAARFMDPNCTVITPKASNYMYKSGACIPYGIGYPNPDYTNWMIPPGFVGAYQVTCQGPESGATAIETLWLDNNCTVLDNGTDVTPIIFDGHRCNAIPIGDGEFMYMRGSCFGMYSSANRISTRSGLSSLGLLLAAYFLF